MVKLYSEAFERTFFARRCSWTHFFYICVVVTVILMPFILAFATNSFWNPPTTYYGKPNIKFTNEIFVEAEIGGQVKSYSNVQVLNQNIRDRIDGALFKSFQSDDNYGREYDDFEFDLSFKTGGSSVTSIAIFMHFTFFIQQAVDTKLKAIVPIFIQPGAGSSISSAVLVGQLRLDQRTPFSVGNGIDDTMYNYNFTQRLQQHSTSNVYNWYTNRNYTLNFDHSALVMPYGNSDTTSIRIEMNVPQYGSVIYTPGFLQSLKLAWVQYFALLFPIYLIIFVGLFGTSVKSGIFETVETSD